ncbi:MAG: bacteriohemerythrin, partial [Sulfuritalea sp.]|nr:bacteriohemerythrin [Sulfuritalea sp.]
AEMAQLVSWTPDLSVGIEALDDQHRRIVDYINELHEAGLRKDRAAIGRVLDALMEYTVSHFSFEEALMKQAGYDFFAPHKKVHELFTRRIIEYRHRFKLGEDVAVEIQGTLVKWLMNHIKREDMNYSAALRASQGLEGSPPADAKDARAPVGVLGRLFRRK